MPLNKINQPKTKEGVLHGVKQVQRSQIWGKYTTRISNSMIIRWNAIAKHGHVFLFNKITRWLSCQFHFQYVIQTSHLLTVTMGSNSIWEIHNKEFSNLSPTGGSIWTESSEALLILTTTLLTLNSCISTSFLSVNNNFQVNCIFHRKCWHEVKHAVIWK